MEHEWTFEGYWNVVIGARNAEDVVQEFRLTTRGQVDEWLRGAEADAWIAGAIDGDMPDEWREHHDKALRELQAALTA